MERCSIIYNPAATKFNINVLKTIKEKFKNKGLTPKLIKSKFSGHIPLLVKEENPKTDLIVTLGGDGTIGEAIRGFQNCEQNALYSHISTGTANDVKANLGLDNNPITSAEKILNGTEQTIDIVTANDIAFGYVSCFGCLTNIPYETKYSLKKHLGKNGYIISAVPEILKLLTKKNPVYNITFNKNGKIMTTDCILGAISNSKGFGGTNIYPQADIDDGLFEVLLLKKINKQLLMGLIKDYLNNDIDLEKYRDFLEVFQTDYLNITFNDIIPDKPLDHDGDKAPIYLDENNRTIEYKTKGKIKMLMPKK